MTNPTTDNTTNQKLITTVVVLVVITFLVLGINAFMPKADTSTAAAPTTGGATTSQSTSSTYKDGVYMATGKYASPGGTQTVDVSLTLANNVVTDATVQGKADGGVAQIYQSYFVKGYKKYVIGKKITDIRVSRVAGSSLTSKGFSDAIKQIELQAKS